MKKSQVAQGRRRARELAVQFLYSLSIRPEQDLSECLGIFTSEDGVASEKNAEVKEYLSFLIKGIWSRRIEIDNLMRQVVTGWRPERMVAVDRAVLRMAIFEGFLEKAVPVAVAISEAVELASTFATEDSGKFVNGVLGKLARFIENKENEKFNNDAVTSSTVSADR